MRFHVVRHELDDGRTGDPRSVSDPYADGGDSGSGAEGQAPVWRAHINIDHPSVDRDALEAERRQHAASSGAQTTRITSGTGRTAPEDGSRDTSRLFHIGLRSNQVSGRSAPRGTRAPRSTRASSSTAPRSTRTSSSTAPRSTTSATNGVDQAQRLTPYESGLAAVARRDVHIERVWPMRSPSTGSLEASSSAYFQSERRGTPPATIVPVGGLRMNQAFSHQPVMATEVVDLFGPVPPGLVVDATLGGGGHAAALLGAYPALSVLGIDRDPSAVAAAVASLGGFGDRAIIRRSRFDVMAHVIDEVQAELGIPDAERGLSGVLFDLGVSSPQLDVAERGFSYRRDAALDMRMDPTSGRTAADVVNQYDEESLVTLFTDNGEGRFARRIARAIISARPLATTGQLADVVRTAIPAATRRTGGHPARRVFQAIRIAVNEELDQLETALDDALDLLRPGGRCVVIAYHSGEDRLVKSTFTRLATDNCHCPPGLPCVCGANPQFRLVVRGSRKPGADEVAANPRSEAARLRVIERLPAALDEDLAITRRTLGTAAEPGEVA